MKKLLSILLSLLVISPLLLSPVYSQSDKSQGKNKDKDNPVTNPVQSNYTYEVSSLGLLDTVKTSSLLNLPITIKNTSSSKWDRTEVTLAYHWVDTNGQYEVYRGDETSLKKSIDPNKSSTNQTIQVRAPELPGNYTFVLDPIYKDQWFSSLSSSTYKKVITVTGSISENESKEILWINGGDEYTNNPNVQANLAALSFQPGSTDAAFVYEYAQLGTSISNWGIWRAISGTGGSSLSFNLGITGPYSGPLDVFGRFRAFKKFSSATPLSYGDAQYHYGRSEKTTDAYSDDIFFDNIPPQGSIVINDGANSTSSRNVSLKITATDNLLGMTGSGIDKMRLSANCAGWGDWKSLETSISSFNISSGSTMSACVQFKDNAGNISETYSDSITFYVPSSGGGVLGIGDYSGVGIGSHTSPYADLTVDDLTIPTAGWRRYIGNAGIRKWNDLRYYTLDAPAITYMERIDEDHVTVWGIGIRNRNPIDLLIKNEYRDYPYGPSHWETFDDQRDIDLVRVKFYKQDGSLVGTLENSSSDGRWKKTFTLGGMLNDGDEIYARVFAYDTFYFDNLKKLITPKITEDDVPFELQSKKSERSVTYGVPATRTKSLWEAIEKTYDVTIQENDATWEENELSSIAGALSILPPTFANLGSLKIVKETITDSGSQCSKGASGYTIDTSPNTVYMCDRAKATTDSDRNYQWIFIHELSHDWQKRMSSPDIGFGRNVLSASTNILHRYYQKLDNIEYSRWMRDETIIAHPGMPGTCRGYSDGLGGEANPIFVSWYACVNGYNFLEIPVPPGKPLYDRILPEEEMAESITSYFLNPGLLMNQDTYDYMGDIDGSEVNISGDLKRHEFINEAVN